MRNKRRKLRRRYRYRFVTAIALVLLAGATAMFIRNSVLDAHSAPGQGQLVGASTEVLGTCQQRGAYRYFVLRQSSGFVLARSIEGESGQPLGSPQPVANFGNGFGQLESDAVDTMQLSPDGCYLAIDGTLDHGEQVWVFDLRHISLTLVPANVMGNFLNWLPENNGNTGHAFLYRPLMPLGPDAPRTDGAWNPGLWIVDAATGQYRNIDIHMSSAFLVDAASSPDGTHIVYSTSLGLGLGSQTWLMDADGSHQALLFSLAGGGQSIVGMFAWSPDGSTIAYERLDDSPVPFQPAGLWIMNSSGTAARYLASTDGGHGYSLTWSPDGRYIAYIARANAGDHVADYNPQSLQSTVAIVNVTSGASSTVATPALTGLQINDHPQWIGNLSLSFTAYNSFNLVLGGSPRFWSARIVRATSMSVAQAQSPEMSHVAAIE